MLISSKWEIGTFFGVIGKNCVISNNWEYVSLIGNFFSHLRRNLVGETGAILYRETTLSDVLI